MPTQALRAALEDVAKISLERHVLPAVQPPPPHAVQPPVQLAFSADVVTWAVHLGHLRLNGEVGIFQATYIFMTSSERPSERPSDGCI